MPRYEVVVERSKVASFVVECETEDEVEELLLLSDLDLLEWESLPGTVMSVREVEQ